MFSHAKLIAALMLAADASIAPIGARRLSLRSVAPDVAERVRTMADPDISDELRASLLACIIEDDLPGMAADLGERVRAMGDPSLSAEQRASIFAIDEDLFGDKSAPVAAVRKSVAPDVAERVRAMANAEGDEMRAKLLAFLEEYDFPNFDADVVERLRTVGDSSLSAEQRAKIFAIDDDLFGDKSAPVAAVQKSVAPDVAERVRAMANAEDDEMRAILLKFLEDNDFANFDADVVERLRAVGDSSLSAEQRAKIFAIDDELFGDKSAPVAAVQKSVAPDVAERVRAMANAEDDEMRAILLKFLEDNDFANFDADVVERLRAVGDSSLSAEQRAKIFAIDEDLFGEK